MKRWLLFVVTICFPGMMNAQQIIGVPAIVNYTREQYGGSGQTWDVSIGQNGILYFANNEGLLTFNGQYWKVHPVPNHTRLRSVLVQGSRIYVGAQDDFGYYQPDASGVLQYTSLKPLIPSGLQQFADIWDIAVYQQAIFFRSNHRIFEYRNDTIKVYPAKREWRMLASTPSALFAQDYTDGLLRYNNGKWEPVCADNTMLITAILPHHGDTLLVTTLKDGLFSLYDHQLIPQHTPADEVFRTHRIYTADNLGNDQLLIGTTSGGSYVIDKASGQIIQRFSIEEGSQNNNVLKVFADNRQNIWLGLDNGIDLVRYNTAVKLVHPDKHNFLTSYAAQVFRNKLYIGTSDGVYTTPLNAAGDLSFSKHAFERVEHTKGQVWNLSVAKDQLLLGHHEGAFRIDGNDAAPLLGNIGCWLFLPLQSATLVGCYNGLHLLYAGKAPVKVPGLFESLRFLAMDKDSTIWASHPYRGVYKLHIKGDSLENYHLYTQADGLPSDYNNFVYRVKGNIMVATKAGIYEYNTAKDRFGPSASMQPYFREMPVKYLREDANGNIWFVSDKTPGVVDFRKRTTVYFPELKGKVVSGFEYIYPYNDENIFVGAEKGMYHINYKKYVHTGEGPGVMISQVTMQDTVLYGGYWPGEQAAGSLPNQFSNFRFEFAAPAQDQGDNIQYSYQLAGYDRSWSEWTNKTEKEYTNLPYGDYTFLVKSRNNLGNISEPARYAFRIRAAWYQTVLAKTGYVLLLIAMIWWFYRRQQRRFAAQQKKHREEQAHLIYMHKLEQENSEQQLVRLQNEKLAADVQFKNKELATATMNLVQRGKLLSHIKEELEETIKNLEPSPRKDFRKVMRLFEEAENNEEDWQNFSHHFDEVHNNFLHNLKKQFPELTPTDMKLCAYLRLHLTTKEIAQSMGISVRGVETSRYRLRKKLNIPTDTGLHDFLNGVT